VAPGRANGGDGGGPMAATVEGQWRRRIGRVEAEAVQE